MTKTMMPGLSSIPSILVVFFTVATTTTRNSSCSLAYLAPTTTHHQRRPCLAAFNARRNGAGVSTRLNAEGGPPQYEKRNAVLRKADMVADGTAMLHIDIAPHSDSDDVEDKNETWDYQPGHVLALEIENTLDIEQLDEKTAKDTKNNNGWMRGPYTVSRATNESINIMIRVVGNKSKIMAEAQPGTPIKIGGQFHVPIKEGINDDGSIKRVVLISTGVGIGPCIGAIEKFISDDSFTAKVDLYASFRNEADVPYRDYLDQLAADSNNHFFWTPQITSDNGRISASDENIQMVTKTGKQGENDDDDGVCSVNETHYHLIGNGQMVNEWKSGLSEAGVLEKSITTESYFNHRAEISQDVIKRIVENIIPSLVEA